MEGRNGRKGRMKWKEGRNGREERKKVVKEGLEVKEGRKEKKRKGNKRKGKEMKEKEEVKRPLRNRFGSEKVTNL
jgi:hypothetical protein